jgi:glycosyltransferase involved in cell wall biosynthesis
LNKKELYLFAPNVSHGGGFLLLKQLLLSASYQKKTIFGSINKELYYDNELKFECKKSKYFVGQITDYFSSNYHLAKNNEENITYLFFGNVPPLIKPKGRSFLYIHGKLLVEPLAEYDLPLATKIKVILNKALIRLFHQNVDLILVQTPSMIRLIKEMLPTAKIECIPFYDYSVYIAPKKKDYDFIYPSYAYKYKNHNNLMKAFELLSKDRIYPKLLLALDTKIDADLVVQIKNRAEKYNLNIDQLLNKGPKEISKTYQNAGCLIWPSLTESFGLPIVEASRNGLDIIASDLEYIKDLIDISNTYLFDPNDHYSIAETIKHYFYEQSRNNQNHRISIEISSSSRVVDFLFSQ